MGAAVSTMFDYSIQSAAFQPPPEPTYRMAEATYVTTIDGQTIAVKLFSPAAQDSVRGGDSRRNFVLFSHGNADDIGQCAKYCQWLCDRLHCDLITYDYVNYGHSSPGTTSQSNMKTAIEAVYNHVTVDLSVPADCLYVLGKSLGSAPSVYLCSRPYVAYSGLILVSPLASGFRVLCDANAVYDRISDAMDTVFCPSIQMIPLVTRPIFIIHGLEDSIVNVRNANDLQNRASRQSLYPPLFLEAGHNDMEDKFPEVVLKEIARFLRFCRDNCTESYQ